MSLFAEALLIRNESWGFAVLGGVVILLTAGLYSMGSKSKYPLPPGPKGSPIIGNLRQVPAERSDVQFAKWAKEYREFVWDLALVKTHVISDADIDSDIIYINLLGQPIIVLNSVKSAVDLLDKKGAAYSDRPPFILLEAYCNTYPFLKKWLLIIISRLGFKNNLALTRDGLQFRKLRKAYGNFLSARSSLAYRDTQLKHAREMAVEIEKYPEKWHSYLSLYGFQE